MWRRRLITSAVVAGIVTAFVALLFQPWLTQVGFHPGGTLPADARR